VSHRPAPISHGVAQAQLENLLQETLPSAAFNRVLTNQPLTGGLDVSYRL
jgi:hypothetical protein